jgi:DNA-binding LytR/AlgR family response regulator
MEKSIHLLLAEDDLITAEALRQSLTEAGFRLGGVARTYHEALRLAERSPVDLAIVDVQLAGQPDGIALASALLALRWMPIIFLTGNTDEVTFSRAKAVQPAAFLNKPFRPTELTQQIRLILHNRDQSTPAPSALTSGPLYLSTRAGLVRVDQTDICYLEADGNYTNVHLTEAARHRFGPDGQRTQSLTFTGNLGYLSKSLSPLLFRRLSKSLIVNLDRIDRVEAQTVVMDTHSVLLTTGERKKLLDSLAVVRTR